jgi:cytochrome c oxidase assembly factor CtaG
VSVLTSSENWPLGVPFALILAAGVLYVAGVRRQVSVRRRGERRWRAAAFGLGLFALFLALDSPIAAYDDRYFSVHMTQHVLLMMVAPPLIVLGRPWAPIWQLVPLGTRRAVAGELARAGWAAPVRATGGFLARPLVAWILANGIMVLWHLPRLYDATVTSAGIHYLEHALFFTTSLLLWLQLIDSPPFHARLNHLRRSVYATAALAVGWILAIVLALSPSPLYAAYADQARSGLSAIGDQQLAAGVLWVPGSIALTIAICVNFYRRLYPKAGRRRAFGRPALNEM